MAYSMKQALLKGSALDNATGPPATAHKFTVTLTKEQLEASYSPDPKLTWESLRVLLMSQGIPVDQLKQGIVGELEHPDGSLTLELR